MGQKSVMSNYVTDNGKESDITTHEYQRLILFISEMNFYLSNIYAN